MLESHEGARIGCKLSSFAFALTVQDLYRDISAMLSRRRDGSCIKAATDDVIIILRADRSDERALYALIEKVWDKIKLRAEELGLSFTNDKAQLLLPKGWVPTSLVDSLPFCILRRSDTFTEPSLQGMEIVGSPVGSSSFCKAFVAKTLNKMIAEPIAFRAASAVCYHDVVTCLSKRSV